MDVSELMWTVLSGWRSVRNGEVKSVFVYVSVFLFFVCLTFGKGEHGWWEVPETGISRSRIIFRFGEPSANRKRCISLTLCDWFKFDPQSVLRAFIGAVVISFL